MSKISLGFGVILILLGLGFFVGTGSTAKTALIPAFLGCGIAVSGALAMKPSLRPIFAHLALVLGALGVLAGIGMGAKTGLQKGLTSSAIEQLLMDGSPEVEVNGEPSSAARRRRSGSSPGRSPYRAEASRTLGAARLLRWTWRAAWPRFAAARSWTESSG